MILKLIFDTLALFRRKSSDPQPLRIIEHENYTDPPQQEPLQRGECAGEPERRCDSAAGGYSGTRIELLQLGNQQES